MAERIIHPSAESVASHHPAQCDGKWRVVVVRPDKRSEEVFVYSERHRATARLADAWRAERDGLIAKAGELQAQADSLARAIRELEEQG